MMLLEDVLLKSEKNKFGVSLLFFFHSRFLYILLSDISVAKNSIPFLILCNKQDQTMTKGCSVIKSLLEKEM
jgi:signal recognition particle receptor subunit beta